MGVVRRETLEEAIAENQDYRTSTRESDSTVEQLARALAIQDAEAINRIFAEDSSNRDDLFKEAISILRQDFGLDARPAIGQAQPYARADIAQLPALSDSVLATLDLNGIDTSSLETLKAAIIAPELTVGPAIMAEAPTIEQPNIVESSASSITASGTAPEITTSTPVILDATSFDTDAAMAALSNPAPLQQPTATATDSPQGPNSRPNNAPSTAAPVAMGALASMMVSRSADIATLLDRYNSIQDIAEDAQSITDNQQRAARREEYQAAMNALAEDAASTFPASDAVNLVMQAKPELLYELASQRSLTTWRGLSSEASETLQSTQGSVLSQITDSLPFASGGLIDFADEVITRNDAYREAMSEAFFDHPNFDAARLADSIDFGGDWQSRDAIAQNFRRAVAHENYELADMIWDRTSLEQKEMLRLEDLGYLDDGFLYNAGRDARTVGQFEYLVSKDIELTPALDSTVFSDMPNRDALLDIIYQSNPERTAVWSYNIQERIENDWLWSDGQKQYAQSASETIEQLFARNPQAADRATTEAERQAAFAAIDAAPNAMEQALAAADYLGKYAGSTYPELQLDTSSAYDTFEQAIREGGASSFSLDSFERIDAKLTEIANTRNTGNNTLGGIDPADVTASLNRRYLREYDTLAGAAFEEITQAVDPESRAQAAASYIGNYGPTTPLTTDQLDAAAAIFETNLNALDLSTLQETGTGSLQEQITSLQQFRPSKETPAFLGLGQTADNLNAVLQEAIAEKEAALAAASAPSTSAPAPLAVPAAPAPSTSAPAATQANPAPTNTAPSNTTPTPTLVPAAPITTQPAPAVTLAPAQAHTSSTPSAARGTHKVTIASGGTLWHAAKGAGIGLDMNQNVANTTLTLMSHMPENAGKHIPAKAEHLQVGEYFLPTNEMIAAALTDPSNVQNIAEHGVAAPASAIAVAAPPASAASSQATQPRVNVFAVAGMVMNGQYIGGKITGYDLTREGDQQLKVALEAMYPTLTINNNAQFESAIKQFQKDQGFSAGRIDGVVGENTLSKLNSALQKEQIQIASVEDTHVTPTSVRNTELATVALTI